MAAGVASENIFPVKYAAKFYDLKNFMRDHPGGVNTLQHYKGKSILNAMQKFGHSLSAYHMLSDLTFNGELKDVNLTGEVSENGRIIKKDESAKDSEEIKLLEELEGRLDWSKALLNQLEKIAPHYSLWVNSAVYRKCRLFSNPLLERLTYTPWYMVPIVWIPIILYIGWTQYTNTILCGDAPLTGLQFIGHLVLGLWIWSALEYSLHRWVFHLDPGNSITMIKIHFLIHGLHHKMPFDGLRQVFPPVPAAILAVTLYTPLQFLFPHPQINLAGALCGYLIYDMIHYYVHHGSPRDGSYLYAMKRYHSNHHFINHDKAFGISCKLWDYVFQTFVQVKKLGFSLHW